jgi:6-phosphogluconolactonase
MPTLSRRHFLATAAALPYTLQSFAAKNSGLLTVYFGTDTDTNDKISKGVYESLWNPATGTFTTPRLAIPSIRPTWLAQHGRTVYVLEEINDTDAVLIACSRQHNGDLHTLNSSSTKGPGAAYVSIHPSGRAAYVANYAAGSITSFGILPNGRLTPAIAHFQYTGHGPSATRQTTPHAHSAVVSPDGNFLLVNDLGLDQIHIYRIDASAPAKLTEHSTWHGTPGSGSRHLAFAPNGHTVYNINEMASTIDHLHWDAATGTLTTIGAAVSTLPADFKGNSTCAEILVSPDGRFVYASNRGYDSVAVFSINPAASANAESLTPQQTISTQGKTPRHITLSPDANWLIAANQDTSNLTVFQRDAKTGALTAASTLAVPHPMFVLLANP